MRAYRCYGCGRGLTTDLNKWDHCRKCGSGKWNKLKGLTYPETVRILWMTRGELVMPPEGSLLEKLLKKWMKDRREVGRYGTIAPE